MYWLYLIQFVYSAGFSLPTTGKYDVEIAKKLVPKNLNDPGLN